MTKKQLLEICRAAYIACAKMKVIYKDGSYSLINTPNWDYITIPENNGLISFKRFFDDTKRTFDHKDITQINIILP